MQTEVKPSDGGLSAPKKRRRPRTSGADTGTIGGGQEPTPGTGSPIPGVEASPKVEPARGERFPTIDPLDIPLGDGGTGSEALVKRRGRKPKEKETVQNLATDQIEGLLITACYFLGNVASCPELYVTEEEAQKVGAAFREFAKYHPVPFSEKRLSEVNMGFALFGVFGPKVRDIFNRRPKRAAVVEMPKQAVNGVDRTQGERVVPSEASNPLDPAAHAFSMGYPEPEDVD